MEKVQLSIPSQIADRISILCGIARSNGSLISLQELLPLLPVTTSEDELARTIGSDPFFSSMFQLKEGFVTERMADPEVDRAIKAELEGRLTAANNMMIASQFTALLRSISFKVVAVSGSTSYNSASKSKDLDLFCIAPVGETWLSLTKGLLLARFFRLLRRSSPQVCLSCVMDEEFAMSTFRRERDALFARDAIQTRVLVGRREFLSLLQKAVWIRSYYPRAYASLTAHGTHDEPKRHVPSHLKQFANIFLFLAVGTIIKTKSSLLNRKLLGRGKRESVFAVRLGRDHLIFESRRYVELRRRYAGALSPRSAERGANSIQDVIPVRLP